MNRRTAAWLLPLFLLLVNGAGSFLLRESLNRRRDLLWMQVGAISGEESETLRPPGSAFFSPEGQDALLLLADLEERLEDRMSTSGGIPDLRRNAEEAGLEIREFSTSGRGNIPSGKIRLRCLGTSREILRFLSGGTPGYRCIAFRLQRTGGVFLMELQAETADREESPEPGRLLPVSQSSGSGSAAGRGGAPQPGTEAGRLFVLYPPEEASGPPAPDEPRSGEAVFPANSPAPPPLPDWLGFLGAEGKDRGRYLFLDRRTGRVHAVVPEVLPGGWGIRLPGEFYFMDGGDRRDAWEAEK